VAPGSSPGIHGCQLCVRQALSISSGYRNPTERDSRGVGGLDARIDPDRCPWSGMAIRDLTLDLHGEGRQPAPEVRDTVADRI
jgi:hypothetical protein